MPGGVRKLPIVQNRRIMPYSDESVKMRI